MRWIIMSALLCAFSSVCLAQWNSSGVNINYTSGIVSVGSTKAPAGFKLAVGGSMIAEEVVIKVQTSWPDYVFEPGYKRLTLTELEKFIISKKHLPGVPTADRVAEDGVSLGEMNAILLRKVEELTLYVIELKKEIDSIKR